MGKQAGPGLPEERDHYSTQEIDHGQESSQDREEDRPEGEEGRGPQAGRHEGPWKMTLTLTQITNRSGDLSGEIKAATTALTDCEAAEREQTRLASIASQATDRARARLDELKAERADLAEQAREAILAKGEPPPLAENGPEDRVECLEPLNVFDTFTTADDLATRLMARSEENMNGAFTEATR